jgi:hypothetical protein
MAKQSINVGTAANDKKGDSLRAAFQKVNANFTELYTALGLNADGTLNLGAFEFAGSVMSTTDSTPIVIDQSVTVSSDLTIGGDLLPNIANGGNLGSLAKPFRSLYVSNSTVFLGGVPLSLEAGTNELRVNNVPISQNITYTDIPNAPRDVSDLTDTGNLLGGGAGGGLSITDFGRGFTDTLDNGKITTNKLYNRPANQGLNNHFELSVTNGGVVALPDGSIINGATLKTIAGNYAGITAGPASPAGRDEDSWVWVDNDGATIATKYSTDNHTWTFNNNGGLTFPQGTFLGYSDPGGFIIDGAVDKDIAIYTYSGADAHGWTFGTDGDLTLPEGGDILDSNGDSVLGGGGNANTGNFTFEADTITNGSGLILETDRGTLAIGTNMETPGVAGHFHIGFNGSNSEANANDLFLGDDYNYVKLPGSELDPANQYGVEISANDRDGGSSHVWRFGTDGALTLPAGGDILNSNGDSVLGGGSYTPDDSANWNSPTVNTVAAALDELAAKVAALENFEIDGGNAYTPAAGELIIDGNGA